MLAVYCIADPCVSVHVRVRSKVNDECLLRWLSTLAFETGSLTEPDSQEFTYCLASMASAGRN